MQTISHIKLSSLVVTTLLIGIIVCVLPFSTVAAATNTTASPAQSGFFSRFIDTVISAVVSTAHAIKTAAVKTVQFAASVEIFSKTIENETDLTVPYSSNSVPSPKVDVALAKDIEAEVVHMQYLQSRITIPRQQLSVAKNLVFLSFQSDSIEGIVKSIEDSFTSYTRLLNDAKTYYDSGNIAEARSKLDLARGIREMIERSVNTALSVIYGAAETGSRVVEAPARGSIEALKFGCAVILKGADFLCKGLTKTLTFATDYATRGMDDAKRNLFTDLAVEAVFSRLPIEQLGNQTLKEMVNTGATNGVEFLQTDAVVSFLVNDPEFRNKLLRTLADMGVYGAEETTKTIMTRLTEMNYQLNPTETISPQMQPSTNYQPAPQSNAPQYTDALNAHTETVTPQTQIGPLPISDPTPLYTPTPTPLPQTLSVSLSASPSSITAGQSISLTAAVSGTIQGTINYTFYCNRSDSGTNIISGWNAKFDGVLDNPKTAVCNYSNPGNYTAKVIAERGSASPAEARISISVTSPPSPAQVIPAPAPTGSSGGGGGGSIGTTAATNSIITNPILSLGPTSGPKGTRFTFAGSGFKPGGVIQEIITKPDGTRYAPNYLTANAQGNATKTYDSSTASIFGTYSIYWIDQATGKQSNTVQETISAN